MSARETVTFYLHPKLRKQAEQGKHNFIRNVAEVLTDSGLAVAFDADDSLAKLRARTRPGRSLFLMDDPVNDRGLTFRKTYVYPFWHIEKQAQRWEWPVAHAVFDPATTDKQKAANFYRLWRQRLFEDAPQNARKDGFVYVPLQGQLLTQRSFQSCCPIDMVKAVLAHDKGRQIMVTLHPSESYTAAEQATLEELVADHDRLFLRVGGTDSFLQNCDYIVTQNSGVGFMGYFFGKPLILFGRSDFHHIALKVADIGIAAAFATIDRHVPDYAAYLHWFLQEQAINAGRPEAKARIRDVLRSHDWPV